MSDTRRATPPGNATALSGMKQICAYVGKSEKTVGKYIQNENFPATKIGGIWESDEIRIDSWRLTRIDGRENKK